MPADDPGTDHAGSADPGFIRESAKLNGAVALARALRLEAGDERLEHGLRVAMIIRDAGYEEDVVVAALLQAVIHGADGELERIRVGCGDEVSELVAALIEDPRADSYERRLAAQRTRVARSDRVTAAIYAADQLVRIRALRAVGREPTRVEFRHYQRVARTLGRAFPDLPFIAEISFELGGLASGGGSRGRRR